MRFLGTRVIFIMLSMAKARSGCLLFGYFFFCFFLFLCFLLCKNLLLSWVLKSGSRSFLNVLVLVCKGWPVIAVAENLFFSA